MKSIKNSTVLNTGALLVDFVNEHWFIYWFLSSRLHPRKSSSLVLSWSAGASVTRSMKAQDTKRAFKLNFPNFPATRPRAKFFEPG